MESGPMDTNEQLFISDLSLQRKDWKFLQKEETRLLKAMTVQESVLHWLELQRVFEWQLKETESIFAADRREALAELQKRLLKLNES